MTAGPLAWVAHTSSRAKGPQIQVYAIQQDPIRTSRKTLRKRKKKRKTEKEKKKKKIGEKQLENTAESNSSMSGERQLEVLGKTTNW